MTVAQGLTREEKIAKARVLQGQGLDCQQIAEELGVAHRKTVWGWLNPDAMKRLSKRSNARQKEAIKVWRDQHRASCTGCDSPLRAGSASPSARGKDRPLQEVPWVAAKPNEVSGAARRPERCTVSGASPEAIAEQFGVARSTVCSLPDGWPLLEVLAFCLLPAQKLGGAR